MLIKDIMTKNVITVSPDASLKEVGTILKEKRISGIPVVDQKGCIVGIVTLTDMLKILDHIYQWKELERKEPTLKLSEVFTQEKLNAKARDVMTKDVVTLEENSSIDDVMRVMFDKKIHTIPITSDGKLVGVIGKRDLVYLSF